MNTENWVSLEDLSRKLNIPLDILRARLSGCEYELRQASDGTETRFYSEDEVRWTCSDLLKRSEEL